MKKAIIITLVILSIIVLPLLWLNYKEWQAQRNLRQAFSAIKMPGEYRFIASECGRTGFKLNCSYRFYTSEPLDVSTIKISKILTSAGYNISYIKGGLDGPNQQAYAGYSSNTNTSLTYKEIERAKNVQYEQGYGNVQFSIYR